MGKDGDGWENVGSTVRFTKPYRNPVNKCTGLRLNEMGVRSNKSIGGKGEEQYNIVILVIKGMFE